MKTRYLPLLFVLSVLAPAFGATATEPAANAVPPSDYVEMVRADLKTGATRIYAEFMKPTEEEAKIFWPIYREYEQALFKLGDQRIALVQELRTAVEGGKFDAKQAKPLAQRWFDLHEARLKLWHQYYDRFAAALSPLRAAQFVQIEYDIGLVIDLVFAAERPLIGTTIPAAAATPAATPAPAAKPTP
jgi:hypothetical protein